MLADQFGQVIVACEFNGFFSVNQAIYNDIQICKITCWLPKMMKRKYINPKSVEFLLGKYSPINPVVFSMVMEEALDNINKGYVHTESSTGRFKSSEDSGVSEELTGICEKLLAHNRSINTKSGGWDLYGDLDFDIVHESGPTAKHNRQTVRTYVNAYFHHTEFARPEKERRVVLHIMYNTFAGTQWSISFPIQLIMNGYPSLGKNYVGYAHSITLLNDDGMPKGDQHCYIGITKRNWLQRMSEHFKEVSSGSNKTFHRAWREYAGRNDVLLGSELITAHHTFKQIMDWEEWAVDLQMKAGTSLNMIPGGFKGMRFLHEHRLIDKRIISLKERERAIKKYQLLHPRTGIPNLIISELWKDENYALKVICGAEGRLYPDQVRKIRELNELDIPIKKITTIVGAKNILQVQRVLKGKTYSRIH